MATTSDIIKDNSTPVPGSADPVAAEAAIDAGAANNVIRPDAIEEVQARIAERGIVVPGGFGYGELSKVKPAETLKDRDSKAVNKLVQAANLSMDEVYDADPAMNTILTKRGKLIQL